MEDEGDYYYITPSRARGVEAPVQLHAQSLEEEERVVLCMRVHTLIFIRFNLSSGERDGGRVGGERA